MPRKPANDNRERPAWYDAKLLEHQHFLKMLAGKFVSRDERDELVQDTVVQALRRWSLYKDSFAFTTWLGLLMKNVLSDRRAAGNAEKRSRIQVDIDMTLIAAPAEQEDSVQWAEVLGAMPTGREGFVLHRRLLGDDQKEIAVELGVSQSRVQQIEARGVQLVRRTLVMRKMTRRVKARMDAGKVAA